MKLLLLLLPFYLFATNYQDLRSEEAVKCLQLNLYHEARGSNLADQAAVADVVLNRVESSRFPNTVCEVVKQARLSKWWKIQHNKDVPIKNKCQFSWYCDGRSDDMLDTEAATKAYYIAYQILHFEVYKGITEGATHYFATYINPPRWSKKMQYMGQIGSHKYYKTH